MGDYKKSNREKRLSPVSKAKHWCEGCDANYLHAGDRCRVCNTISGKRTLKKETNAR